MVTTMMHFHQRLQWAIDEGAAARRSLILHAAGLPTEQLAALSPDVLRLLGSKGLVTALEQRSVAKQGDAFLPPAERTPAKVLKKPLFSLVVAIGVLTALGPVPEHLAPVLASTTIVSRSIATATWPACARLDHAVDGCVYSVGGGGGLSLLSAANHLGIAAEDFITINAHIPDPASSTLPRGSQLVVWRDRLTLEGITK